MNLYRLSLNGNLLEGEVPSDWGGDFAKLRSLDVSRNFLIGDVPAALAEMPALEELRVNHNQMFGVTPEALVSKNLSVLVR